MKALIRDLHPASRALPNHVLFDDALAGVGVSVKSVEHHALSVRDAFDPIVEGQIACPKHMGSCVRVIIGRSRIVDGGEANWILVGCISDAANDGEFVDAVAGDIVIYGTVIGVESR